jgi:hypothetical protein
METKMLIMSYLRSEILQLWMTVSQYSHDLLRQSCAFSQDFGLGLKPKQETKQSWENNFEGGTTLGAIINSASIADKTMKVMKE